MATVLQETEEVRPTGVGVDGQGPDVDLPSTQPIPQVEPTSQTNMSTPTMQAGNNNWGKIQEALEAGYSRDEVSSYLQQNLGVDADQADKQVIESVQDKIKSAQDEGYSTAEIKDYLIVNRYDGSVIDSAIKGLTVPKDHKKFAWDPNTTAEEAQDVADLYKNIYGKYSTFGKQIGGAFSTEMGLEARREVNQLNASIAKSMQDKGFDTFINPETGDLMVRTEDGMELEVDSSMINDIWNSKFEIGGAIAGAITGAKTGSKVGAGIGIAAGNMTGVGLALPEELVTGPVGAGVGAIVGGVVGGAAGASTGKALDMTTNALILKEQLEASLYMTQMKEAAIFDSVAGVVGAGLFKMGASGLKQVMRAYDFALAGNTKGAYNALLDNMLITDDQAREMVKAWEKHTGTVAPGKSFEEKAIGVIADTEQGAEAFVAHAASKDPRAAAQVVSDIDKRAKDLVKLVDSVADDNIGDLMRNQVADYTADVKNFYGEVKQLGAKAIDGTDYRFDYDKLAIDPVLENISKGISDPRKKEAFVLYAERIGNASQDRTFSGLVELRQAVNDFKYSRAKLKKPDIDALNKVINKVDSEIGKTVREYMPDNGKEWLTQFGKAKTEYAKMKQLEGNMLYKLLTRKGISEHQIQLGLKKYIDSLDGTFMEVMEKLPTKTRAKAEGAVMKQYVDRYTLGQATDKQAIHFPMISRALEGVKMETAEAKHVKTAVDEIAKIFKNDVNLSKVSGNIAVPKFQSYLTTDPIVRLKFEVASGVFNYIKTKIPGKQANNMALLKQLEKTLENPMHVNTVNKFIKSMPKESQEGVKTLVDQLRVEMAKNPARQQDFVNMYKQSASGKLVTSNGQLGKGVYLVDSVKNPSPTAKVIKHEVNMSKMATLEDISALVGREIDVKEVRNLPNINKTLQEKGYIGIRLEGKAMLFPETITK